MNAWYECTQDERIRLAPRELRLPTGIDPNDCRYARANAVPDNVLISCKIDGLTLFPDMMYRRVWIVSPEVRDVLLLYQERTIFRRAALIDPESERIFSGYIAFLPEIAALHEGSGFLPDGSVITHMVLDGKRIGEETAFALHHNARTHIILRQEVLESLLRRGLTIGYQDVDVADDPLHPTHSSDKGVQTTKDEIEGNGYHG